MNIYSTDVLMYGTVYIRAENEEQARALLEEHCGKRNPDRLLDSDITPAELASKDIALSDEDYFTGKADVVLSPAVTLYGADPDASFEVEEEEDEEA